MPNVFNSLPVGWMTGEVIDAWGFLGFKENVLKDNEIAPKKQ